ncbi:hypothetical protein HQ496_07365 [bacterium]|nr:hypothetical protein [bacterium]
MRKIHRHHTGVLITFLFSVLLLGCDNTIEPIDDSGSEAFAIHGYLDMRVARQVVRIEALRPNVLSNPISLEDVQVSTIESESGLFQIWKDSTVILNSGEPGFVFAANFRPELGRTYRLIVSRNGESGSEAIAKLPAKPPTFVNPPVGDSLNIKQRIVLQGMTEKPIQITLSYVVVPADDSGERTIRIAYGQPGVATSSGWEFDVDLVTDRIIILNQLGLNVTVKDVEFRSVSFEMTVFSDEWKEPQKEANLDNAHGFFGSVGVFEHAWFIDSGFLNTLGFVDGQKRN